MKVLNKLLDALLEHDLNNMEHLSEIIFKLHNTNNDRIGIGDNSDIFPNCYRHVFLLAHDSLCNIYFSKYEVIFVFKDSKSNIDDQRFHHNISEDDYFQLSLVNQIPYDVIRKINKFAKYYKSWEFKKYDDNY